MTDERPEYNDDLGTVDGPENLWRAVLMNAIAEASGKIVSGGESPASRARIIKEARDYVTIPNRDFDDVCVRTGLDPEAVREHVRKQLKQLKQLEPIDAPIVKANRRTPAVAHTIGGRTMTTRQWAAHFGVSYNALNQQVFRLGSLEAAVARYDRVRKNANAPDRAQPTREHFDAKLITFNGETLTVDQWAARIGMNPKTLDCRLNRWPVDRALTEPLHGHRSRHREHRTRPGVVINLHPLLGTGVGSTAQEIPEITFSDSEVSQ